jgi:hypothetical protein
MCTWQVVCVSTRRQVFFLCWSSGRHNGGGLPAQAVLQGVQAFSKVAAWKGPASRHGCFTCSLHAVGSLAR